MSNKITKFVIMETPYLDSQIEKLEKYYEVLNDYEIKALEELKKIKELLKQLEK